VRISKGASSALLLLLILIAVLAPLTGILAPLRAEAQGSPEVYSNFTVTSTGYLTVYLYGVPPSSNVLLWWGIEPYPQGPWYTTSGEPGNMETPMTYNSSTGAFEATIGPFKNGTWVAYVFNVNGSQWINYEGHPFWNWNVIINPPMNIIGYTKAWVLPNGSIVITTIGRPPDKMILWWGLTTGPQTGLPWYTTAGTPGANQTVMTYNPLWGNYTAIIGPFKPGQWVQWVYHDVYTGWWIHNSNVSPSANFAIQDVYLPVQLVSARYSHLAYKVGQQAEVQLTLNNTNVTSTYDVALVVGTTTVYNSSVTLPKGCSNLSITFPVNFPMGFYDSYLYVGTSGVWKEFQLPQLIVLNTTGRKPISVVIVWNMHQPLYLEPNGTWGQPWVQIHTGQDLYWNGSLVGAYELQAMLLNEFPNLNVTIDFTPVLLYQWEAFLHQSSPTFLTTGVNVTHDINATEETIALYRKLVQEGRLQVLTVPFYHPLEALVYDNGWQSDLLAQLLMGENMTYTVFGVNATGVWTPEMGFNMGLLWLYADAGINVTILDYQAFVNMAPALTVVSGNMSLGPYGIYVVQNSLGQRMYVLFRDDDLSNMFSFIFFYHQSPQEAQQELIDYLANVYMEHPGAVVVVALDGENPLIFNQEPQAAENLYAIYQALSEAEEEGWLVTQTVNQAIETHPVAAVLTNLPEESWTANLNNWNNGNPAKVHIWDNVSLAREYLVAFSNLLGMPISPVVPPSFAHAPNASVTAFEAMTGEPAYITVNGVTYANPLYMYYTMWNWLYASEGSDWTYAAGPPNYGPQWFSAQPIVYDSAIVGYVRQAFSKVTPIEVEPGPGHDSVELMIRDDLGEPFYLKIKVIVVVSNGMANASAEVTLRPGNNVVILKGITVTPHSQVQVYIYAPVRPSQLGGHVMPISRYGLLMSSKTLETNQPQPRPLKYYYAWVAAVIAIVVTIVSALADHLRL